VAQVVKCLPSKHEALSSNSRTDKKKKNQFQMGGRSKGPRENNKVSREKHRTSTETFKNAKIWGTGRIAQEVHCLTGKI
jgi:hypothetical protein